MTGVGDIIWAARSINRHFSSSVLDFIFLLFALILTESQAVDLLSLLPDWWYEELVKVDRELLECPKLHLPDCRKSLLLCDGISGAERPADQETQPQFLRWGVLLPLTSRTAQGSDEPNEDPWIRLETNLASLVGSIPTERRARTCVYIAIDLHDPVYDKPVSFDRIRLHLDGLNVKFINQLAPMYQGRLCWIWALLAKHAVADGADFFVLLGDDVCVLNADRLVDAGSGSGSSWQSDVEDNFSQVASETSLPFGCACVAIQDSSFPCFPTFPVMHRLHFTIFGGELFPSEFHNQHGDPFLYEVYRRYGASRFTASARLCNQIGGAGDARYHKEGNFVWRDTILTKAIEKLTTWLTINAPRAQPYPCIDVVIPTYRCNVEILSQLANLGCSRNASVHTIIVVDRPTAENLSELSGLCSYSPNRTVRVDVMPANVGASTARNKGLQQSFGDHCILLDDDVVPEVGLIEAYLSAIDRYPNALGYVGLTRLPAAQTIVQHAIIASNICYFYGISNVVKFPPWGVTANLCVKSRTNNSIWFSSVYPRTGGGEDVDFCIRLQMAGKERLVSVPSACVTHPFWENPLRQVRGWASGDVLCLSRLPHRAFRTLPNWAEIGLLCVLLHPWLGSARFALLALVVEVVMLVPRFFVRSVTQPRYSPLLVSFMATLPTISLDVVRLASKLMRLQPLELCCQFDWMNGTGQHPQEVQFNIAVKMIAFLLSLSAVVDAWGLRSKAMAILVVFFSLWCALQAKKEGKIKMRRVPSRRLQLALRPRKRPFVVLAHQRSGSNLLCGHLASHPSIAMHFELFNEKAIYSYESQARKGNKSRGGGQFERKRPCASGTIIPLCSFRKC